MGVLNYHCNFFDMKAGSANLRGRKRKRLDQLKPILAGVSMWNLIYSEINQSIKSNDWIPS